MKRNLISTMLSFGLFFIMMGWADAQKYIGLPATKVLEDSSWQPGPHTEAREITYLDRDSKPVVVQVLKARLKKKHLMLEAATPDDKDDFGQQIVTDEMQAENRKDRLVIAGVNADFFNMKNGIPLGPVIKEGRMIKGVDKTMVDFVGVLKSGKVIIGDSVLFKKKEKELNEALGARAVLLKNRKLLPQNISSLSTVHHPRTAFGVKGKRTVWLVTVDGRQPAFSNGISLTDLGRLMRFLGAENAVNLDGGGSTTMAVWDEQHQQYRVRNRPSGKTLRPVANSWILVRKK